MPNKNHQEQIPLIRQPEQIAAYHSINSTHSPANSTVPRNNYASDKPCDAASHFFIQQFKKDFPLNDFSGSNSLNIFKF
ncbi:hypothetical protein [Rickettsiella endosymbiont of Dermanyssus gallinae]|uniref:hypothetical protein n=1 Tax=Rickettsiella endosymbiont of Dermanyssus gallinae TaxID=2856608 RepID=UPI001C52E31E|nr:hypothetical protein [Rickettsiella endosymbiont of Dermanyssus gallinae]